MKTIVGMGKDGIVYNQKLGIYLTIKRKRSCRFTFLIGDTSETPGSF